MALLLHIETATNVCSVCLAEEGKLLALKEVQEEKAHGSKLAVFITEILQEAARDRNEIKAVAVSKGPGSYTGLRIGTSTAKGICYGLHIPLIAINTLKSMANGFILENQISEPKVLYCPMIDARRMEVYTAIYDLQLNVIEKTSAKILSQHSFRNYLDTREMYFFGNGAFKCNQVFSSDNAVIWNNFELSSRFMISLAYNKYRKKQFEDIAYFEPFYLKEFITTTPKKNIPK